MTTEQELHQALAKLKQVMREALGDHERDLFGDIATRIAGGKPDDNVTDELAEKAVEFEVSHPTLAKTIKEVMETLKNMGV